MCQDGPLLHRLLHVDDDPDILELTRLALEDLGGLELRQLTSGGSVEEVAAEFGPDLILLDVMMPDMSGEEMIQKLGRSPQLRSVPVVFMTAKGNQLARERLLELGACAVILKPFDPTTLADQLREIYSEVQ